MTAFPRSHRGCMSQVRMTLRRANSLQRDQRSRKYKSFTKVATAARQRLCSCGRSELVGGIIEAVFFVDGCFDITSPQQEVLLLLLREHDAHSALARHLAMRQRTE